MKNACKICRKNKECSAREQQEISSARHCLKIIDKYIFLIKTYPNVSSDKINRWLEEAKMEKSRLNFLFDKAKEK